MDETKPTDQETIAMIKISATLFLFASLTLTGIAMAAMQSETGPGTQTEDELYIGAKPRSPVQQGSQAAPTKRPTTSAKPTRDGVCGPNGVETKDGDCLYLIR